MIWLTALKWLNPKRLLYIAGAALIAFTVWQGVMFIDAKYEAEAKVISLTADLAARDEAIRILNKSIAQRADAVATADAVRDQLDTSRNTYEEIRRAIAAANEEDNDALSPVLRDALRALDGMQ